MAATNRFEELLMGIYMIEHWILASKGIFQVPFKHEIDRAHLIYWDIYMHSELTLTAISDSQKAEGVSLNSKAEIEHDERE
jgi:hypothetical protein